MSVRPFFIFFYEPVDYIHDGDIVEIKTHQPQLRRPFFFHPPARPPYDVTRPTTCADAYRYDNSASREITGSCVCVCVCACDEMFKSATRQLYSKTSATPVCLSVCVIIFAELFIGRRRNPVGSDGEMDDRKVLPPPVLCYIITAA
jgi:hypothetical protein